MAGWESSEAAQDYIKRVDIVAPRRREILSTIAGLAATFTPDEPRILDIGSGAGDVTAAVLEAIPRASVCMVDLSDEMLRVSRERFVNDPRVRLVKQNVNEGIPVGRFDCVVSCFAIHHVLPTSRVKLYSSIHEALPPGGLFVSGDRFVEDSANLSEHVFDKWIEFMVTQFKEQLGEEKSFAEMKRAQRENEKEMGDMPGTIWEMQRDLRQAGFTSVDCIWKYLMLGIIAAVK